MLPLLVPEAQFKRVEYILWTTTTTTTMTIEKKRARPIKKESCHISVVMVWVAENYSVQQKSWHKKNENKAELFHIIFAL